MVCNRIMRSLNLAFVLTILAGSAPALASAAQDAVDKGTRLKAAGDKTGAMTAFAEAVRLEPQNAFAHNELGTLYFEAAEMDEAIAEFKRAADADPNYALAHYNYAFSARKAGRYAEAVSEYQRYVQLKPDDPDAKFGLAESYRALGRNAEAAAAYDAYAAQETRESEREWVEKARATARDLRNAPPAVAAAPAPAAPVATPVAAPVAAPAQDPFDALIAQGDQAMAQHRTTDAVKAYQAAVVRQTASPLARFKLGLAYAELGYLPQAIDQWQWVVKLDPSNQGARDNIQKAQAKLAAAQQQAAAAAPPVAPAAAPSAAPSAGAAPRDAAEAQRLAKTDYEQAVQLISQRRYQDAVGLLTQAVQLHPQFSVAYVARGSAYIGLGRFQDAVTEYQKGLQLNQNQASPLFGLGEAYRGMGDRTRAAQYYQECASSSAPDAAPLRDLAHKRFADLLK